MPPRARHWLALAAVAASTALAAAPALAELRNVTVEVQPEAPTWQDEITVTVRGEASCFVELFDVSEHFVPGVGMTVRVELEEACLIDPPGFLPFELTAQVSPLEPREYTVQVMPAGDPATVLAAAPLDVFEVAAVEILFPAQPPTDAAPFVIQVRGITATCHEPAPPEIVGNAIVIDFPEGCEFLPAGPFVETFDFPVGPLPAGDYEVRVRRVALPPGALAKADLHVFDAAGCLPESDVLCLNRDRFAVRVQWRDFEGNEGVGQALPLLDDTGLFWFFHPENVELTVKVLDACGPFGHFWVFVASGSTVEYEIRVTDTHSDPEQTSFYRNRLGQVPSLIPDTGAFPCP